MLYPDFTELVALRDRKSRLRHPSYRSGKSIVSGNHHSPFRGQGLEFDSVREYVPGDDIRNIDWRVTARTGSPHLKLFKEERERQIVLCVDMNATMRFGTKNTFKSVQAARVAALLGWRGIANHDRIGACLFGNVPTGIQFFASQRTHKSFCAILKMFTQPFLDSHCIVLDQALQRIIPTVRTGSLVYLISDFMDINRDFQQAASINRLSKKCDLVFVAINDQADHSIYPLGMLGFSIHGSQKTYINTASLSGRESYTAKWKENRQWLYEATTRLKIPLIELTTESNIYRDLSLELKKVAQRKKR